MSFFPCYESPLRAYSEEPDRHLGPLIHYFETERPEIFPKMGTLTGRGNWFKFFFKRLIVDLSDRNDRYIQRSSFTQKTANSSKHRSSKTQYTWCMTIPNFTTSGSSPLPDVQTPSAKLIPARSRAQLHLSDKPLTSFQNQEQQSWEEIHIQHQATHKRLSLPAAYQNFQRTEEAAGIPHKLDNRRRKQAKCFKYNQPWLTPVSKYSNWFIFVLNWNRMQ